MDLDFADRVSIRRNMVRNGNVLTEKNHNRGGDEKSESEADNAHGGIFTQEGSGLSALERYDGALFECKVRQIPSR